MSDERRNRVVFRIHANHVIAGVVRLPEQGGLFIASAAATGLAHYCQTARSLEEAKALADQASGCPQPCTCQPWPGHRERDDAKTDDERICAIVANSHLHGRFFLMPKTGHDGITFARIRTPRGILTIEAHWNVDSTPSSIAGDLLSQAQALVN